MSFVRLTTLALFTTILGCSGAEPERAQPAPGGYGFEFVTDHLGPRAPPPAVTAAAAGPNGRLAPETFQGVVRRGSGAIERCYDAALAASPGLSGELAVRFVIGEDGAVSGARVERSTLPSGAFPGCVLAA